MSTATAIIIAAYNAEATLERAVRSALAQPDAAEVCIVDDGSSDGTRRLADQLAASDARVMVHSQANAGPAAARNVAVGATKSPWIAILDADDYMLGGRLAALHEQTRDADFIADALIRVTGKVAPPANPVKLTPKPLTLEEFLLGNLGALKGSLDLGFLKPVFRRSFIEAHALRYREDMRLGEDYELYARALAHGARFLTCDPAGYISVERAGSLSKAHSETDLQRMRDCDEAFAAIRPLTAREERARKRHWNSVDCRLQWRLLINAVKDHDVGAAISTFHSPQAAAFLAARLGEQALLRGAAFSRSITGALGF